MGHKWLIILILAAFGVGVFLSNNVNAVENYKISITTDNQTLESNIENTADETVNIQKHEVTINTNSPNGAKVFISSKDSQTTPKYVVDSGPSTGPGAVGATTIAESTGTISNPAKLSPNSFGFALPNTIINNFNEPNVYEDVANENRRNAKFAKLPENDNFVEIYNKGGAQTNIKIPVYYGINTNSLMREGKYEVEVIYTVVTNGPANVISETEDNDMQVGIKKIGVKENGDFYKERTLKIATSVKSRNSKSGSTSSGANPVLSLIREDTEIFIGSQKCLNVSAEIVREALFEPRRLNMWVEFSCQLPKNIATVNGNKYDVTIKMKKIGVNMVKRNAVEYIASNNTMQNFFASECNGMAEHATKELVDARDGEMYLISKLKDGRCWMTQNLRLQLTRDEILTSEKTNVKENWKVERSTETSFDVRHYGDWDYRDVHSYYNVYKPEYGAYYNYATVTARSNTAVSPGRDARDSICPRGWRLPRGSTSFRPDNENEQRILVEKYKNSATIDQDGYGYTGNHGMLGDAPRYILSGHRSNELTEGVRLAGERGVWMTSTAFDSDGLRGVAMYVNKNSISWAFNDPRSGESVRCIKEKPQTIANLEYMQDMTPEHCANSTEHQTATLKDKRDNNTYTIAKLKDGKCWMTQNLRLKLDISAPLKPTDSDVSSNWTPSRSTDTASCQAGTGWDQDSEGYKTVRSCYQSESTYHTNGVYYTHTAATAGTAANINNNGDEATDSICPKGWRLPKTGTIAKSTNNEFYNMTQHYIGSMSWYGGSGDYSHWQNGTHNLLSSPQNFFYPGYRWDDENGVAGIGSVGNWWSSTVYSSNNAYLLGVNSSYVYPRGYGNRYNGFTVRCIAR